MTTHPKTPVSDAIAVRPNEAARLLGVSRALIFEWLARGELRSVRAGRARLIPVAELHRIATEGIGRDAT